MATEVGSLYARVGADLGGFNRGMDSVDRQLNQTGGHVRASFGMMTKTAKIGAAGIVGGIVFAVNAAGNFESSLNTLQAVTKATSGQMKQASTLARALGRDITLPATSAKDAADAMTELAKGGLSVSDTFKAAKGVLQLSAAAQITNAEAATITARALNSFSLSGDKAVHVADVLANAANVSTGEITDMAMALQQSSAIAKSAGLSIEDTATAISLLANKGVVGSDAGTSLKTMLMSLVPETNKAKKAMSELGVSTFDASGQYLPLRNIIEQYHGALSKLTPEQRASTIQTIFGSDAARAANIIFGQSVKTFDEMRGAVSRSGGASELAAAKMKGFKGSMEAFKSTLETVAIELGLKLLPAATNVMRKFTDFIGVMERHSKVTKIAALSISLFVGGILAANVALKIYRASVVAAGVATAVFNVLVKSNPFVRFAVIVLAAVAALAVFSQRVRGMVKDVLYTMTGMIRKLVGLFAGAGTWLYDAGIAILQGLLNGLRDKAGEIKDFLGALTNKIPSWKGPPGKDANLLRPAGIAIMRGLYEGLRSGMPAIERSLTDLTARIAAIGERRATEDRAAAVRDAVAAVAAARKKGEGVLAAEQALARAREDVTVAAMQSRLDKEQKAYDKRQTAMQKAEDRLNVATQKALDIRNAAIQKAQDKAASALSRFTSKIGTAFDAITGAFVSPAQRELNLISSRRQTEDQARAVVDAEQALADARTAGDPVAIVAAERSLARAREDIVVTSLEAQARAQQTAWEQERTDLKERMDDRLAEITKALGTEGTTWSGAMAQITEMLASYGVNFTTVGELLGAAFAASLQASISSAVAAAQGVKKAAEADWERALRLRGEGMNARIPASARSSQSSTSIVVNMPNYLGSKREAAQEILTELGAISRGGGALFTRMVGVTV